MQYLKFTLIIALVYSLKAISHTGKIIAENDPLANPVGSVTSICATEITQNRPLFLTAAHLIKNNDLTRVEFKDQIYEAKVYIKDELADFALLEVTKSNQIKIDSNDCVQLSTQNTDLAINGLISSFKNEFNYQNTTYAAFLNYFDIQKNSYHSQITFLELALFQAPILNQNTILVAKISNTFDIPTSGMSGSSLTEENLSFNSDGKHIIKKELVGLIIAKYKNENFIAIIPSQTILSRIKDKKYQQTKNTKTIIQELKSLGWIPTGDPIDKK
jgi:hypothetical protein